jgi:CRP-like cAMP-binding protein
MIKKPARAISKTPPKLPNSDGDGNEIHNEILLSLPREQCDIVFSKLEFVRLSHLQMVHEVGDTIRSAYFCNSGMISTLNVFADGKSVEVGLIGKEGFVGLPLIAGFRTSPLRANVQISGSAFRIDADALSEILLLCPDLTLRLYQFSQVMAMQVAQIAACNRLHEVEERLARWLLMCADRAGNHRLPLTQDLLGQMLGTRRASVTLAAGVLQKAGFIEYRRGEVEIINRPKLEETSCECYEAIRRQIEKWRLESPPPVCTVANVRAFRIVLTPVHIDPRLVISACY